MQESIQAKFGYYLEPLHKILLNEIGAFSKFHSIKTHLPLIIFIWLCFKMCSLQTNQIYQKGHTLIYIEFVAGIYY